MSFAPKARLSWPTFPPCVTHDAWRLSKLSRKVRLHRAEEIFVPLDRQVRVVAALQQQLVAADGNRLVDFAQDLLEAEHVAVARADVAIERAEVTLRHADVRV